MNFEEHAAKQLLSRVSIPTPEGALAASPDQAHRIARQIMSEGRAGEGHCDTHTESEPGDPPGDPSGDPSGNLPSGLSGHHSGVVVKAQVPAGKRGKSGAIALASDPAAAHREASRILGMTVGSHVVHQVLVEAQVPHTVALYAAVLNDPETKGPLVLFSTEGGMDIEEVASKHPDALHRVPVDIRLGFGMEAARCLVQASGLAHGLEAVAGVLASLYDLYTQTDAELLELNPLAVTAKGEAWALDCKLTVDDAARARQGELVGSGSPDPTTELEAQAQAHGLKFIELDGDIGVLANGAGLTMTTMDVITHYGGRPANFLEIGGDAYAKAEVALSLVLANPRVKSLVVNFCGAFARTDVMTQGVVEAWRRLEPRVPVYFSVEGTGAQEAILCLREGLGLTPYPDMDEAIKAAVANGLRNGLGKGLGKGSPLGPDGSS